MKFSCERAGLLKGIQTVQNVVSDKGALPILSNVLIEAQEGLLRFTATDLELGIQCSVDADVQKEGAITVPSRTIGDIIRELPDGMIEVELARGNWLHLRCGKIFFKIIGLPKDEFPKLPEVSGEENFTLPQEKIRAMIRRTSFAVSREESRYALGGIFLTLDSKKMVVVATDGRRLAKYEGETGADIAANMILPAKAARELNRIMVDTKGDVKIWIGENEARFEFDSVMFIARFLKGVFPEYEKVIPKKHEARVTISGQDMRDAVRRVALLTSESSHSIKITVQDGKITFASSTAEKGEASEEMDVDYKGEEKVMAFNPSYIMDFLKVEDFEKVHFDIIDSVSPAVLRPEGDERYLYVVMPVKV